MLRPAHEAKHMALSHQNNPGMCDMSSPYIHHHFNTSGLVLFLQRAFLLQETAILLGMASGGVSIQQTGRAEAALRSHSHSSVV